MENRPTLYLPIEIKAREFRAKILLAQCAVAHGFRVYLGSKPAIDALVRRKPTLGGVYFYKGGKSRQALTQIKKKVDSFVVLDEEMGPMLQNIDMHYRRRIFSGTEHLVDKLFVIGARHRETIDRVRPELLRAVEVTGWPRIDLWRGAFRYIYEAEILHIRQRFGPFILFASNFGVQTLDRIPHEMKQLSDNQALDRDFAEYFQRSMREAVAEFEQFTRLMHRVDDDPDFPTVVVRPHPGEDIAVWRSKIGHLKKVHIVYEGDIGPWLHASRAMVHRGCTTALQAYVGGVPSIYSVLPGARTDTSSLSYRLSIPAPDYESLKNLCMAACADGLSATPQSETFEEEVLLEGGLASERIARSLAGMSITPEPSHGSTPTKRWSRTTSGRIREWLARVRSKNVRATLARKLPGGVRAHEVARTAALLFADQKLSILDAGHNLVEIDAKQST